MANPNQSQYTYPDPTMAGRVLRNPPAQANQQQQWEGYRNRQYFGGNGVSNYYLQQQQIVARSPYPAPPPTVDADYRYAPAYPQFVQTQAPVPLPANTMYQAQPQYQYGYSASAPLPVPVPAATALPPPITDKVPSPPTKVPEVEVKEEKPKPLILVGKRRGGKALPTGVVKKVRPEESNQGKKDPWSQYMNEVKRYKEQSCEEERKNRPLVK